MAFVWSTFVKGSRSRQYVWLRGNGQDGKSKVLGVLQGVFGPAAAGINNTLFQKGNQFLFSAIYGKRLVIYADCKNAKFGMTEFVLNVAGPRESNAPGIGATAERFLDALLHHLRGAG